VSRRNLIPAGGGLAALAVAAALVPALSGCGVSAKGDFDRGKQLFTAQCSTCHTLRDAGSVATQGPDLDAAFAQARAHGMDPETIAGVVKNQVENPRPSTDNPSVSMPADLVTGKDLDDVASYIGTVAGNPEFKGPELPDLPGAPVFLQNGCASCHVLEAAGSSGTTGPDLDDAIGKDDLKTAAGVRTAIVDPNKQLAPGYPKNVMPDTFGQSITPTDLNALVQFLLKCSGKGAETSVCQPTSGGSSTAGGSSSSSGSSKAGGASKSGGSSKSSKSTKSGSGGSSGG
jgi:mono/diheme cytochrome c family protein